MWVPQLPHTSTDASLLLRRIMETWKLKKRLSLHGIMRYLEALKKIGEGSTHPSLPLIPPSFTPFPQSLGGWNGSNEQRWRGKLSPRGERRTRFTWGATWNGCQVEVGVGYLETLQVSQFCHPIPTALLCPHLQSYSDSAMFHSCWKFKSKMILTNMNLWDMWS